MSEPNTPSLDPAISPQSIFDSDHRAVAQEELEPAYLTTT